jgi:hypothetical protein
MKRQYLLTDTTGRVWYAAVEEHMLQLFESQTLQLHQDGRAAIPVDSPAFSTLRELRCAVAAEIEFRRQFPGVYSEQSITEWYNSLRVVPIRVPS